MMKLDSQHWFSEICEEAGSAFSMSVSSKLHEENSQYQKIEIYNTHKFGHLMAIDGFVMLTQRDNFLYHEMMTHPVLFTHRNPQQVVIIGGGDCGTLREVLKHSTVQHALQVEIDERVTRLSEQFFPELCESNDDPRAQFYFGDGIQWMKEAAPNSVDVIIVDSTDPLGPAEGLFSKQFYADCLKTLKEGGILVHQSESPLYHIELLKSMRQAMLDGGFDDLRTLPYPQICYPSGWWSATMAGYHANLAQFRVDDAGQKNFETQYYNADIHQAALALPEFMRRQL